MSVALVESKETLGPTYDYMLIILAHVQISLSSLADSQNGRLTQYMYFFVFWMFLQFEYMSARTIDKTFPLNDKIFTIINYHLTGYVINLSPPFLMLWRDSIKVNEPILLSRIFYSILMAAKKQTFCITIC